MELAELKQKTIAELLQIAEGLDIPGVSGLRKSELIYKVMESQTGGDSKIFAEGVLEIMDEDELKFIIGHEMGHAALGHTWINTLVGGMGGVPLPFGAAVLFTLIFRWWNRACEHSADRAGLLVCANPQNAISALVKLVAGDIDTAAELKHALQAIDKELELLRRKIGTGSPLE